MESNPPSKSVVRSKKRLMMPQEFLDQFSSKKDLLNYLREQS